MTATCGYVHGSFVLVAANLMPTSAQNVVSKSSSVTVNRRNIIKYGLNGSIKLSSSNVMGTPRYLRERLVQFHDSLLQT